MDPNDPKSWGAPGNPSGWFVESDIAKHYFEELDKLEIEMNHRYEQ